MLFRDQYQRQVRLLMRLLPIVARESSYPHPPYHFNDGDLASSRDYIVLASTPQI